MHAFVNGYSLHVSDGYDISNELYAFGQSHLQGLALVVYSA